jgi:peptidoglycan/xylan/chitin deacetylase (PgdA/CDA1 family)
LSRSFLQRLIGKYKRLAAVHLARRPFVMKTSAPIVSFTFDDFPASALHTAGAILEQHAFSGTYYISVGLLGQIAPTGQIVSREDLPHVVARGHELGCHTFAHCDASTTPPADFEASIAENGAAIGALVPGARLHSLSYPIGSPKPGTKLRSGRHFAGCRGGGQTHNAGTIDLNYLSAFFIEQSVKNPERIFAAVEEMVAENGWLIFATHDVAESPTRYGCTPDLFSQIVRTVAKSGAQVMPVSLALQRLGVPTHVSK